MSSGITQVRLHKLFSYELETGALIWREDGVCGRGRTVKRAGTEAGTIRTSSRYRAINLDGVPRLAHRLVWLYVYGTWPTNHIDHINGNCLDNRLANLRDVTRSVNLQNMRHAMSSKKHTDLIGAMWHASTRKWRALIKVNGKQVSLGYFSTDLEAHQAYLIGKRRLHEGCTI